MIGKLLLVVGIVGLLLVGSIFLYDIQINNGGTKIGDEKPLQESMTITKISPITITIQDGKFVEIGGEPTETITIYGDKN